MKNVIVLLALMTVLSSVAMAAEMPSSIGWTDQKRYTDSFDQAYKANCDQIPVLAQMELLNVESNLLLGYLSVTVHIDNATVHNVYGACLAAGRGYELFYKSYGWPDECKVYVYSGTDDMIGSCTIYSKWLSEDYDTRINKTINATKVYI